MDARPYTDDEVEQVQFYVPADLIKRLDAIADVKDTNQADLLTEIIREYGEFVES